MPRLFLAVWPPDHVIEDVRSLRRKDQRGVRFLDPEMWHITLRFLGDAAVDDVVDALDGLDEPSVPARLGPGVDVLSGRSLIVPVHGLDELAAAVAQRTADIGEPPRARFLGHLTIARLKPRVEMPPAFGAFIESAFVVDEIALVSSRLNAEGARYTTESTWPLRAVGSGED